MLIREALYILKFDFEIKHSVSNVEFVSWQTYTDRASALRWQTYTDRASALRCSLSPILAYNITAELLMSSNK